MANPAGYFRFPSIHGDRIVFVSEDDLWSVPVEGGPARRLSANPGLSRHPVLSPNGRHLAFTGRDEGQDEVWVMPAEGGPARRLTFLGAMTFVVGWSKDSRRVILATDSGQPFAAYYHLFEVPVGGGEAKPLNLGPAMSIAREPKGKGVVIGRNTGDPARWKRYRGGTAGTLWIDRNGTGSFGKLVDLPANLAGPMWIGKRFYFLSDHEGTGNIYSVQPDGSDITRHTDHRDFYVRFPQTDGKRIVYCAGADLFYFDLATGESTKVEVDLLSARPQRNRKFVDAGRGLSHYDVHPEGHSLAVTARGRPFTFAHWEGAVSQHGVPDGARYRLTSWLPDGKRLVAVTDQRGEEQLVILKASGAGRDVLIDADIGRAVDMAVSPVKPYRVAVTNHRNELVLVDLEKKTAKTIDRSGFTHVFQPAWSPDGKWLAYGLADSFQTYGIKFYDVTKNKAHRITRPDFKDFAPAFDTKGEYLYFLSYREYDPVYDRHAFDLGFPRGCRVMCVPLTKNLRSPFDPEPRAPGANGAPPPGKPEKPAAKKPAAADPVNVKVDLAGIEDRVVSVPVPEGNYQQVACIPDKILYTSYPIEGSLAEPWPPGEVGGKGTLECFDLLGQKSEVLVGGISDFTLSPDAKVLVYRTGNRIRALPAGTKPADGSDAKPPSRESGWIDLSRLRVSVDPGQEWAQMYREAWRLQRDQFWTEDMSGIDWKKIHDRYRPLVDRAATRSEFSDLLWELQGELGTSHAYELGGDYRPEPAYYVGQLGADIGFDAKAKAWTVRSIPRGDSWAEASCSPLAAPGLGLRKGSRILAVGGRKVDRSRSPAEALVNLAGQRVQMTVADPSGRGKRDIVVKTLRTDRPLRYRHWVESNRELVHKKTGGKVGYVHVPNMGAQGYAEFHRYFLSEVSREGLIIDVRFNGGGHVSPLLLEKLIRRRVGYDTQRWGEPMPYPMEAPAGPMVALTNERAGSDGDIFSHCYKLYGLGPLIGKRTWGGVVGIWPRHALVDGTVTTQPEFSFWFEDVGFGVENYGTDPDIEVEILPQDHEKGRDTQLLVGIREVEKILVERPVTLPDFSNRPQRAAPRLPRRKR